MHFVMYCNVLMLCRKFEPIPTKISGVMNIFLKLANIGKKHGL